MHPALQRKLREPMRERERHRFRGPSPHPTPPGRRRPPSCLFGAAMTACADRGASERTLCGGRSEMQMKPQGCLQHSILAGVSHLPPFAGQTTPSHLMPGSDSSQNHPKNELRQPPAPLPVTQPGPTHHPPGHSFIRLISSSPTLRFILVHSPEPFRPSFTRGDWMQTAILACAHPEVPLAQEIGSHYQIP
jgi:hypothetical protein